MPHNGKPPIPPRYIPHAGPPPDRARYAAPTLILLAAVLGAMTFLAVFTSDTTPTTEPPLAPLPAALVTPAAPDGR